MLQAIAIAAPAARRKASSARDVHAEENPDLERDCQRNLRVLQEPFDDLGLGHVEGVHLVADEAQGTMVMLPARTEIACQKGAKVVEAHSDMHGPLLHNLLAVQAVGKAVAYPCVVLHLKVLPAELHVDDIAGSELPPLLEDKLHSVQPKAAEVEPLLPILELELKVTRLDGMVHHPGRGSCDGIRDFQQLGCTSYIHSHWPTELLGEVQVEGRHLPGSKWAKPLRKLLLGQHLHHLLHHDFPGRISKISNSATTGTTMQTSIMVLTAS